MRMRTLAIALGLTLAVGAPVQAQQAAATPPPIRIDDTMAPLAKPVPDAAQLAEFDAFVEGVRKQFEVPGIAVAIVQDGKIVMERGYGVRELGKPAKVDEHTMFAIASNTKAFTAAALNMLQDEGKLATTDRVIDHLPWFRMSDAYVTREMRIRDLLSHRSGLSLGAGDLLYWPTTTYTTREVAERLKDVPLTGGFREQYAYDNILFGVAQLVVEAASGQSFKQFLSSRVFQPLGMTETRDLLRIDVDRRFLKAGTQKQLVGQRNGEDLRIPPLSGQLLGGQDQSASDTASLRRGFNGQRHQFDQRR